MEILNYFADRFHTYFGKYRTRPRPPKPPMLPLDMRTPRSIRRAQEKARSFPSLQERQDYIERSMETFREDGVTHIYQRRYNSVERIDLNDLILNNYIEKAAGPIKVSDFEYFPEAFHDQFRDSHGQVMLNMGVRGDGSEVYYTTPFHQEALRRRMLEEPASAPRAAKASEIASRIKPSAGIRFDNRHARDLTGVEDLADFAIIRF